VSEHTYERGRSGRENISGFLKAISSKKERQGAEKIQTELEWAATLGRAYCSAVGKSKEISRGAPRLPPPPE